MFLSVTLKRNPALVEAAVDLHRRGIIPPNTYVLDLDAIAYNARLLARAAARAGIRLYMMTKQIGRNPEVARLIAASGIPRAVAVDPWEARLLGRSGIPLGNVGHLVQIPSGMIEEILSYRPEVVTVYSVEKAAQISRVAQRMGRTQKLLLRVVGPEDVLYEGQQGGFRESGLIEAAREILRLPGVRIAGVTGFPCLLYDPDRGDVQPLANAHTVLRCAERLSEELGISLEQINMPSATCVSTIPILKELGATHGEPGHALTGTTPLHQRGDQPELPAMVYVSEVSHLDGERAYVYGGGFYRRSRAREAIVGKTFPGMMDRRVRVRETPPQYIDYYGALDRTGHRIEVGDTAVFAFRTQIFVTRSQVALVEGIQRGRPSLKAIYDSLGKPLTEEAEKWADGERSS